MTQKKPRTRYSKQFRRNWFYKSWFGFLGKSGYQTRTRSAEDAITQLVLFSTFCIALPLFVTWLVLGSYAVLTTLGIDVKENFAFNTLLPIGVTFAGLLISFDLTKEIVNKEVRTLEQHLTIDHDELEELRRRNKELEDSMDSRLRQEQQKYYLARAYIADNESMDWISFERQTHYIHQSQYKNTDEAKSFLQRIYFNRQSRRKLQLAIAKIESQSWVNLASDAAVVALEEEGADEKRLNNDPLMNHFFMDIYLYLDAWLVSSIDNDVSPILPFMPIEDIGFHYPSSEKPDLEAYKRAFNFLVEVFDRGMFDQLISDVQVLTKEEVETCRAITLYLNELLIRINDFANSRHSQNSVY